MTQETIDSIGAGMALLIMFAALVGGTLLYLAGYLS